MIGGQSVVFRAIGIVAVATALISAIPVMRPWEYYNGFVGGPANSFRYFNDEGLDMVLRGREVAQYYHQRLEPLGVIPYITYPMPDREKVRRGIRWIGQDPVRDRDLIEADVWSGTIICSARGTAPYLWWDRQALRRATPAARLGGNLLVFQGSFPAQPMKAQSQYYRALDFIYTSHPDWSAAQQLLSNSIALDPRAFFVSIELGNVEVRLGERSAAVAAYSLAMQYAVREEDKRLLAIQIALASSQPLESVTPLRNPEIE
jgi:hypothetical protein